MEQQLFAKLKHLSKLSSVNFRWRCYPLNLSQSEITELYGFLSNTLYLDFKRRPFFVFISSFKSSKYEILSWQ